LIRVRALCTFQEELALAYVARERCRALELQAGFLEAAELCEQVAAHAWQEVVGIERRLAIPSATARFSSTTGDGATWASAL
jgi:hypothetical protein